MKADWLRALQIPLAALFGVQSRKAAQQPVSPLRMALLALACLAALIIGLLALASRLVQEQQQAAIASNPAVSQQE
ncbi:DUF2970 domain-containing protein [Chitinilyticum litopenaei]|uniref:DUF2970 domain-containing protein n=1 Tax=Chitinilyticum litopenaei TaxID=1121276 RepID=UPI0004298006|nr:DUF2970 domain-containing protein [Chitinilyticum litopenaei]